MSESDPQPDPRPDEAAADPPAGGAAGDADAPGPAPAPERKTLRLEHREADLARAYANAFRSFTSGEELVLDFGFNLVRTDPAAAEASGADGSVSIDWTHRSVMSYRTAKSLAIDLARVVREHERAQGEIRLPGSGAAGAAGAAGGAERAAGESA